MAGTVALLGCADQPDAPCRVLWSDGSAYLVQLRPSANFPHCGPQGTQYQVILAQQYTPYGTRDPATVVFDLAGSALDPQPDAGAVGQFSSFQIVPPSNECTIAEMTAARDDSVTPVNASAPVSSATYKFSKVRVLSDAAHRGNQFEATAVVNYGLADCTELHYTAQAVFPITLCIDDSVCLPDAVPTDIPTPGGRGSGSGLNADYCAFCNLDPALLENPEMLNVLSNYPSVGVGLGRAGYTDGEGNAHDVGVCFLAEAFPSLCPPGSTLSTHGPCIVGPGSNPH